jgi:hypothetical protein
VQAREALGRTCLAVTLALLCAACGASDNGASQNSISNTIGATTFSDRLSKASPDWRRALLLRAITDSDQTCDRVTRDFRQQDYRGMGMWRVGCHDGGDWAVFVGLNGNAQAALCSHLGAGVPACAPIPAAPISDSGETDRNLTSERSSQRAR